MNQKITIPEGYELKKISDFEYKIVKKEELPNSWEGFCKTHPLRFGESWVDNYSQVMYIDSKRGMAIFVYLYALADYFNMMPAYTVAEIAMQNPIGKQSFLLPMALVWAQIKLNLGQWEEIYPSVKMLFLDAPEEKDMRPEAIKIIMDYIGECKKYASE